jgi:hypothetical protein
MATPDPSKLKTAAKIGGGLLASFTGGKVLTLVLGLHIVAGLGAGYVIVSEHLAKRKMTFTGGPPTTNPSQRALEHKVAMGKKRNVMSAPAQAKRITTSGLAKVSLPDMPALPSATDVMPTRMAGLGGAGFGPGGGGGGGLGSGGGGGNVNFFGLRSRIKAVVFCVDVSGSMVEKDPGGGNYQRLAAEVERAINGLEPRTRFGLVVFANYVESYRLDLVDAREDQKKAAIAWLAKHTPMNFLNTDPKMEKIRERHRGTRADLALDKAFRMKPDTIFFVSDGQPTAVSEDASTDTIDYIMRLVEKQQSQLPRRTVIHCVAYLASSGQGFMRELAEKNNGQYQEVQ